MVVVYISLKKNKFVHQSKLLLSRAKLENQPVFGIYRVMQPDLNSFCGGFVLDSVNTVSRNKDSILYQIYVKQICADFYFDSLFFDDNIRTFILTLKI